ncbi:MAG: transcriptional antiterminator, Rof [Thiobacillaceae bacterium]|nr:transcriptional antiterminator, Rof [Thiobacillaceae bacterium]MCX7673745.1 transcriptional antiterminator, Rof [Thiobacillaceae bacterium]MDW8324503.1 hypothetical protein [Burkholderiales bacterium]
MGAERYIPIACAEHERLEYAVLRGLELDLTWREPGGGARRARVRPLDVFTHAGAEWLRLQTKSGETLTLRLDRILAFSQAEPS